MVRRTKDGTRRFICLVFLRGIRERAGDTWYPYRHHLIEAKQSDETNKREGMRAPSLPLPLPMLSFPFSTLDYSERFFFFFSPPFEPLLSYLSPPFFTDEILFPPLFPLLFPSPSPTTSATFGLDLLIPILEDRIPVQTLSERRRDRWTTVGQRGGSGGIITWFMSTWVTIKEREKGPIWRRISYEKRKKDRVS